MEIGLDSITCEFWHHTQQQHAAQRWAMTHNPFITSNRHLLDLFKQHFAEFSHLLPVSIKQLQASQELQLPVTFKPMSQCPIKFDNDKSVDFLAVGGPTALISSMVNSQTNKSIAYLNNNQKWPVANGSAWHLEEDASTQLFALYYNPIKFIARQLRDILLRRINYDDLNNTGAFTWQTLDWQSWLKRPRQWLDGLLVALSFQLRLLDGESKRQILKNKISKQCLINQTVFEKLNQLLNHELLLPGHGSLIVARNEPEVNNLHNLHHNILQEGKQFNLLDRDAILSRYGFIPQGLAFGEKVHDQVLNANYQQLITHYLKNNGHKVIDGNLINIYTDAKQAGGIAEYQDQGGNMSHIMFKQALLSLGNQQILDINNKPLFHLIGITGVSILAFLYTPPHYKVPLVTVCGGTNHVTCLSVKPVPIVLNGQDYHLHLLRITAGACVSPRYRGMENANYDRTFGLGVLSAARITFGKACKVDPIAVYGCSRPVSKFGQTTFIEPYPGVHIQFGAGGGGLTRAPEFFK